MTLPFALPDWMPWWVPLVLLVPILVYALALLLMPFSVFGVKGRLDVLDARLDEIQNEIRHLALRMPEASQTVDFEELYAPSPRAEPVVRPPSRPPIPPAPHELEADEDMEHDRPPPPANTRPVRREPRLDWPR